MAWSKLKLRNRGKVIPEVVEHVGPVKRVRPARHVKATIQLPPGAGYDDIVAGTAKSSIIQRVESAAGWPPGTMVVTPNLDNAQFVDVILSDPRILRQVVPWEGPSWTNGASIADSISIGMYQDGTECEVEVPETQIQIMGQVGSGKSLGGAWNALGEMITRDDVVIWGIDIKKGMQTLGPLAPALHRIATTPAQAIDMLNDASALITPRTNYLSSEGLGKWSRGCGIKYLVVWIEEAPFVMDELGSKGIKLWTESVKAARSAGITVAWSLQRADFREIPKVASSQATRWCFGVQTNKEANLGLSTVQKQSGCTPEMWGQRRPGMSYIDAPNIHESLVSMPLRAWWFGPDDSILKAHAERFPCEDRPYDDLMLEYFEAKDNGLVVIDLKPGVKSERVEPPKPVLPTTTHMDRGAIGRKLWDDFLRLNAGRTVETSELMAVANLAGLSYEWMKKRRTDAVTQGSIKKHGTGKAVTWEIMPK